MTAFGRKQPLKSSASEKQFMIVGKVNARAYVLETGVEELKKQAISAANALRKHNEAMTVIVTLGEKGIVYVGPDTSFSMPALKVQAVDTTAAGDSFCGAFCYGLTQLWPPQKGIEFAVAASAITVTGHGTQPSLPNFNQVSHLVTTGKID
jgi:ribokinase